MKKINLFNQLLPSLQGDWGLQSSHQCGCGHTKGSESPFATVGKAGGRLLLAMIMAFVGVTTSMAQEAYAELSTSETTFTFYYDNQRTSRTGTTYDLNTGNHIPAWYGKTSDVTTVVFTPSFANVRPTTTLMWFYAMKNLNTITGISYLNTSEVTNMNEMFSGCKSLKSIDLTNFNTSNVTEMMMMFLNCWSLTSLDLSGFNTEKVKNMEGMFETCRELTAIYVGSNWMTTNVQSDYEMFYDCTKLVGGRGTAYDASHVDKTYAHIDGGTANPGYLTNIAARQPYATLSDNNTKLTFYYDGLKNLRNGIDLNTNGNTPDWYNDITNVTNVVFDPSFASACPTTTYMWFCNMKNLTTITGMENLNTSHVTEMKWMFQGCSKLTTLDLSSFNTENVTDMYGVFYNCTGLTDLDVSGFDTSNVTQMSELFRKCSSLTSLDLSNWNTAKVTDMSWMFYDCSSLMTIMVGEGWSTSAVTNSNDMFYGCSKLVGGAGTTFDANHIDKEYAHIDIDDDPGYLTYYMTIGAEPYAVVSSDDTTLTFYYDNQKANRPGTTYLIEPNLAPGWVVNKESITTVEFHELFANYHGLTSTAYLFAGLEKLTQINHLERLNTENATSMFKMFSGCSKLTSLNLTDFDTGKVKNMDYMFSGCSSLISLSLMYFDTSNVLSMEGMFAGCSTLKNLDFNRFNTSMVKTMQDMFLDCTSLETITHMNFNTSAVENMDAMFAGCRSLTSLNLPSSFTTQKLTSMRKMFEGCSSLTTLNLRYFNTENVTNMERMFSGCSSLTSVELRTFDTSKVTSMAYMFKNCSSLESLDFSYFNTKNVYNMIGMFDGCGCPTLDVTAFNTSKVVNMESMFANISATSLNLLNFDMSKVTNCSKMFAGASNLTTIYCEDTWACSHADSVFVGCTSLEGAIHYDPAKISGDYANPVTGYFSSKSYAVLSEDGKTLTFYHDDDKQTRPGTKYTLKDYPDWYGARASITKVVFDGSFYYARPTNTSYWFSGMSNLETITGLKNMNTSQVTDMKYMFQGCSKLTILDLSRFNTEKVTTMESMFHGMSAITMLNLGAFKPLNVTDMSNMFNSDTQLTTIYVSSKNWTTASVTTSTGMFTNCNALKGGAGTSYHYSHADASYAIVDGTDGNPGYLTEKKDPYAVQSTDKKTLTFYYDYMKDSREGTVYDVPLTIGHSWANNDDITTVDFDESFADYNGLTDMLSMFGSMSALTEVNHLNRLNTENVTRTSYMFSECTSLTTLDLSGFNTNNVTKMSYMFYGCSALKTIYVGANWDVSQVTSSVDMFTGCTNLKGGAGTTYDANHIDKTYARIDGLNGQPGYLSAVKEAYVVYTSSNSTLTFYYDTQRSSRTGSIYNLNKGEEEPGWYFHSQEARTAVFDPSFADARPTTTYSWFLEMEYLRTITGLEYLNTSEVTNMGHMFDSCYMLSELDVSGFDTGNVTNMEYMFDGLELSQLDVSSFNTSKVTNMSNMFYRCEYLSNLDLTSFNTENVTNMRTMFGSCTRLTTIYVGSGWNVESVENSQNMFKDCTSLVGGQGTTFDPSKIDKEYARIDGLNDQLGYLTAAPYAVISEDFTTLTFYNDGDYDSHSGMLHYLNKTSQTPSWLSYRTGITNVVFDESFASARPTTMYAWFADMRNLITFTGMENLNTSEVKNMAMTFASCNSLTTLDLGNWNTAKVKNMSYMFNGSGNLTTVYVGSLWSTANVTSSGDMFTACGSIRGQNGTTNDGVHLDAEYARIDGLDGQPGYFSDKPAEAYAVYNVFTEDVTELAFYYDNQRSTRTGTTYDLNTGSNEPGWKTDGTNLSVTNVAFDSSFADARPTTTYAWFSNMVKLNSIAGMEYLNTSEVTIMTDMFNYCRNIWSLDVSNFNTEEVTDMTGMFAGCMELTSLDVSNFNTENVTSMNAMFIGCGKLTTLDVSNFNTEKVTNMNSMFLNCSNLTTIYVGSGWKTDNVTESLNMFLNCTKLVGGAGTTYSDDHVDKSYAHVDVVGDPGYFTETPVEIYAVISTDGKTLSFYYDGMKSKREGTKYNVPNGEYAPDWYWANGEDNPKANIETVVFDESFAEVRPHYTYCWFGGMSKLSTITGLENLNTSEVTNMGQMFYDCGSLTSLDLSSFNTKNVTNMAAMFRFCGNLVTVEVSQMWSTANVTVSDIMFENCTSIKGSNGTTYDENHIDKEYARIDAAGTPGYFTYKAVLLLGDVNGDNKVDVADITALTNHLLGIGGSYNPDAADVDGSGTVTKADISALVQLVLRQ